MTRFKRLTKYSLALLLLFTAAGCTAQTEVQKKFGPDADYFIGLRLLQENDEKAARDKFNHCIKKGSYYCAKKSAEALCTFGNIQERNLAASNLINKYTDEDSLLIAVKQFSSSGEINRLIEATNSLDFSKAKNELIRLRLEAMGKRGDTNYENEVYRWFTECPVSTEHYQFYRDFYQHPDFEGAYENPDKAPYLVYTPEQFAIHYRIESYKRNYTYTLQCSEQLAGYFTAGPEDSEGKLEAKAQLISDFGKNYLYGSMDFATNAAYFRQLANEFAQTPAAFYFWFYAGRLFDKAGIYYRQTRNCFEAAMQAATTPEQKDNALWYLLNTSLNFSMESIISSIGEYSRQWKDAEYFEDFFEALVPALLASGNWNAFGKIYHEIDGYASDATTAQFAYIHARLIQEGLADGSEEESALAFERACRAGPSLYYKVLAAYRLGIDAASEDFVKLMTSPGKGRKANDTESKDASLTAAAETLLLGYAYFGFPELIYPEWQKFSNQNISSDTAFYLSDFLSKCAESTGTASDSQLLNYYPQALRIAARTQLYSDRNLKPEELRQVFPKYFSEYVDKYSEQYEIEPSIMYALIRSESFFDSTIISSAGAVGLTQLMEFTAGDIARRFKLQDYSLTDPETNIHFGTYYIGNLITRCENSPLLGFFSYNAGITRVRRWLQSSLVEFDKKKNMPLDLFLETLPFAETREYGRKLISATALYDWLDSPDNFHKTVANLIE